LGIVFQGEILTARTVLGGALIFVGVYFALNLPRPPGLRRAAPAS
jgi:drug/metabolite transporter (DMT)-like permease